MAVDITPFSDSLKEAKDYAAAEIQQVRNKTVPYMRARIAMEKAGNAVRGSDKVMVTDTHAGLASAGSLLRDRLRQEGLRSEVLTETFDALMRECMDQAIERIHIENESHIPEGTRRTTQAILDGTASSKEFGGRSQ